MYPHAQSLQSCPTLCDPMDCSPPGSSVHGMDVPGKNTAVGYHALFLWIFPTQGWNCVFCISCITGRFFTAEVTGEAPGPQPWLFAKSPVLFDDNTNATSNLFSASDILSTLLDLCWCYYCSSLKPGFKMKVPLSRWLTCVSGKFGWLLYKGLCSSLLCLSMELCEWPYNMAAGYPQREWSERSRQALQCSFSSCLALNVVHCCFLGILSFTGHDSVGEGPRQCYQF